ncbi:MAG: hypothetical protein ISN29_06005 [Gammaproteobacteria bacterium AqS3]|nr:hypothetical protein [Gammaproteobacteria bacterium AqS3]
MNNSAAALRLLMAGAFFLLLSACSSAPKQDDLDINADAQSKLFRSLATQEEIEAAMRLGEGFVDDLEALIEERLRAARMAEMNLLRRNNIIYFTAGGTIAPESRDILERHTLYLSNNDFIQFELEVHTRARGSRRYNVGYGEKLAGRIWAFMQGFGMRMDRIRVISYGELDFRPPQADPTIQFADLPENRRGSSYVVIRY